MQWLNDLPFGDNRVAWIAVLAACGIAVLVALAIIYRLVFAHRLRVPGGRTRQPRLGLVDAFSLDGQRQLVLIRRDNVEHLVMIGGPNDVLVESQINRALAPGRENGLGAGASRRRRRGGKRSRQSFHRPSLFSPRQRPHLHRSLPLRRLRPFPRRGPGPFALRPLRRITRRPLSLQLRRRPLHRRRRPLTLRRRLRLRRGASIRRPCRRRRRSRRPPVPFLWCSRNRAPCRRAPRCRPRSRRRARPAGRPNVARPVDATPQGAPPQAAPLGPVPLQLRTQIDAAACVETGRAAAA